MKLYHVTSRDRAEAILREGFSDSCDSYGTDRKWSGVWLSDRSLDSNDTGNVETDANLAVIIDCELDDLSKYEWIEEGCSYREWLTAPSAGPFDLLRIIVSFFNRIGQKPTFASAQKRRGAPRGSPPLEQKNNLANMQPLERAAFCASRAEPKSAATWLRH